MSDALFEPDGPAYRPTELARGPWDPAALHGGPTAALLADAAERHEPQPGLVIRRLTLELLRPVPVAPLTVTAHTRRPGRKVALVEVTARSGDVEVARLTALRLRSADHPLRSAEHPLRSGGHPESAGPPGPPETGDPQPAYGDWTAFHNAGAELRYVAGGWTVPGPATVWVRLRVPVVAGRATTGLMRAAAAADFGNGVSAVLPIEDFVFINPDLTVHLVRDPVGEWVCLDSVTYLGPAATALAESALFDRTGRVGRSLQSLLVDPRLAR